MRAFAAGPIEHPAAWCAVETALLDLFAREAEVSVEGLLGEPEQPRRFRYTTVLGLRPSTDIFELAAAWGIDDIKLKAGCDLASDRATIDALFEHLPAARLRLDLNNAFGHDPEAALAHLGALSGYWAIEEPLAPGQPEATAKIGRALGVPVILDEGVLDDADLRAHAAHEAEWIVNIKVSRVGGLLRALELVRTARAAGWGVIVGAQAGETSLLTRAALIVARAAGDSLRGLEGAIGTHMLAWDPYAPTLRYGPGGWLDLDAHAPGHQGWGLSETEKVLR